MTAKSLRLVLTVLFVSILVAMFWVTGRAGNEENVFHTGPRIIADRWFFATIFDAYFAFLTFYVWVFYKETSGLARAVWFVLIMALGNIAIASYSLIRMYRTPVGAKNAREWTKEILV